jgi:hypothetical protein
MFKYLSMKNRYLNNFDSKELVLAYVQLNPLNDLDSTYRDDIIKEVRHRGFGIDMFFNWVSRAIQGVL